MVELVISGGQTGADQAGWRAAKRFGIATSGWMPRGYKTEFGDRPEFAGLYGAKQTASICYPERTRRNVSAADGTVFFGSKSSGYGATHWACIDCHKPFLHVADGETRPSDVVAWIADHGIKTLNVAGNRESRALGIGIKAERFLVKVFRLLGHAVQEIPGRDHPTKEKT